MSRWPKKEGEHRDEDYPKEPEIVESKIDSDTPPLPKIVKVGDTVGDIVIKQIFGKHSAMYDTTSKRLILCDGVNVDAYHKDLGEVAFLSFSGGTPKVVGFDKAAFKAGIYKLSE